MTQAEAGKPGKRQVIYFYYGSNIITITLMLLLSMRERERGYTCATVCVWQSEDSFWEPILSL